MVNPSRIENTMRALQRFAPWLLLGPISGPLAEGAYRNLRQGETVLAGLYLLAIPTAWVGLVALIRLAGS
jgi:hypothetical protein